MLTDTELITVENQPAYASDSSYERDFVSTKEGSGLENIDRSRNVHYTTYTALFLQIYSRNSPII